MEQHVRSKALVWESPTHQPAISSSPTDVWSSHKTGHYAIINLTQECPVPEATPIKSVWIRRNLLKINTRPNSTKSNQNPIESKQSDQVWPNPPKSDLSFSSLSDRYPYKINLLRMMSGAMNFQQMTHHLHGLYPIIVSMLSINLSPPYIHPTAIASKNARNRRESPPACVLNSSTTYGPACRKFKYVFLWRNLYNSRRNSIDLGAIYWFCLS